jgi:uncharacterized protein (DUF1810 family)
MTLEPTVDAIDPFNLNRFVQAQAHIYANVLAELSCGFKQTHWMWFVFPQIDGLGVSETTKRYAIKSLAEARAYLEHAVLGERLFKCAQLVLDLEGKSALEILGSPDNMKLQSSMTLFAAVSQPNSVFTAVLDKYFDGERDLKTLNLIRAT